MTIESCIDDYVGWCELHRQNKETIRRKGKLLRAIATEIDLFTVNRQELERFLLTKYKNYASKTVNNMLSTLRMFYEHCIDFELMDKNPAKKIPFLEKEEKWQKVFTLEDVKKIIEVPRGAYRSRKEFEMYNLIYSLIAYTGMRRSEVIKLRKEDLVLDDELPYVIIRKPKNKRDRVAVLPVGFDKKLKIYIDKYSNSYMFESRNKAPLVPQSLNKAFERRLRTVGLYEPGTGLHALRRFFITTLLNKGAPLPTVARAVGHKKIDTTMLYYYETAQDIQTVVRLNPLFKKEEVV